MSNLILYNTDDGKRYRTQLYNLEASHAQMEGNTQALYLDFDQRRKADDARAADAQDDAGLKALEDTLQRRFKP